MAGKDKRFGAVGLVGLVGFASVSALALLLPSPDSPELIISSGHHYVVPRSMEITRTKLPDGRWFELHGQDATVYLIDGAKRSRVDLPEARRLASVTVMPGGELLLWGGVDAQGNVLTTGEWFNPDTQHFVRTGALGLQPRAGHTITVLRNGHLLMAGGWAADGAAASDVVEWDGLSRQATALPERYLTTRIGGSAQLQVDGSIQIRGGCNERGFALQDVWNLRGSDVMHSTSSALGGTDAIRTFPGKEATDAPIHGPLVMQFQHPVDTRELSKGSVTLLGPEGAIPVRVVGTEGGRLAFVQLPDDLYPGSRYTLFVKGLHTTEGTELPYTAVGFTTAHSSGSTVMVAGRGGHPAPVHAGGTPAEPPLYLSAGGDQAHCKGAELCRPRSFVQQGAWYPGKNNAPDATGAHWRLYSPFQALPDTHELAANLPKGATALVGQVRQIDERPVSDVEVSIGDRKVRTNKEGIFVLPEVPSGHQELFVDGGSASHGDVDYGRFVVGADVKAKQVNRMPFIMYLPRILPRDEVAIPSPTTREVVVTHPDIPGMELRIPAGSVFKDRYGHVLTHIAIVPTPVDRAPFPLPTNFSTYFTIQPGDAVVQGLTPDAARGIRVVYPNYGHDKPNTSNDFWVYSAKDGWQMYGNGHVTQDAKQIAPDPGVTIAWALGAGASTDGGHAPTPQKPNNCSRGQPIDLKTGILFHEWTDFAINDVVPLTLTRGYSSADTTSHAFGYGTNANFGIHLYSPSGTATVNTNTLVLPCGEGIDFNLVSGSSTWPFPVGTVWEHTGSNSSFYGATLQFLSDNTPDAAHWIITKKDGTQFAFTRHSPNSLVWAKDRFGNQIQYLYNGGLLSQIVSPSGRTITLNYDASNRITSATDNSGRSNSYAYNLNGSLATVTYPDQTTEQYTYDGNRRMLTMRDRRGTVWVTNQYDTKGRVSQQTYADNTSNTFSYTTDANNNITATTVTDPVGNQQYVAFDPVSGYPASTTAAYGTPLAQTTTFVRLSSGLVDSSTDAFGRTTKYTYDALGNVRSVTKLAGTAGAVTTQLTYTSDYNQVASIKDPLGNTTSLSYTAGCLTQVTNALGNSTVILCNSFGQPTGVQDALGNIVSFGYQGFDLQSVTDPLNRTWNYAVDVLGRRIAFRDPLGNVGLVQYDSNDRVTSATDAQNGVTTATYDGNGNVVGVTLPNQAVVTATYDSRNRPLSIVDALSQGESWTYDGLGNVLSYTDRKNQITAYSYDALNRRALVAYADGGGTQAAYDAGNRLTSLIDSTSGTITWTYDDLDRRTSEVTSQGAVAYTYDVAGRRTSMTSAAQATVNYAYDNANRLTSITQGSEVVQFAYDVVNRRTVLILPNGVTVGYGYDNAGQLVSLGYKQGNGTNLGNITYSYDADGRRIGKGGSIVTDVLPASTTQAAVVDLNGRKTNFNGQALSYDANGNLINDGTNTYTWNARNQLVQISQGGAPLLAYGYDALGRRISKATMGNSPTQYLYDGANAVQETQSGAINPILTGIEIDERFARNDVTGRTYFLADALGSTIALTDPTGAIRQQYRYDPYGNVTVGDTGSAFSNPYQYTGREADSAGLYFYRARYYSPLMGSFISEDPMGFEGGQLSFYAYAAGNPLSFVDPLGLAVPGALRAPSAHRPSPGPGGNYGNGTPFGPSRPIGDNGIEQTPGAWPGEFNDLSEDTARCVRGFCPSDPLGCQSGAPTTRQVQFVGNGPSTYPSTSDFRRQFPGCTCTQYSTDAAMSSSLSSPATATRADVAEFATKLLELRAGK